MKLFRLNRIAATFFCVLVSVLSRAHVVDADVLVVGGGASGVSAGIQAARMGAKTIIVEESPWVGGMLTAAGVSAIDGNYNLPAGMWGEFKSALERHYGSADALKTGWVSSVLFEPSVGNMILRNFVSAEENLQLYLNSNIESIGTSDNGNRIVRVNSENGEFQITAKVIIDATELGDVAKMMGVKYDIGMESRNVTNEDIAPEASNGIIQDLTYVAVLKDYGRDVTMAKPDGYAAGNYACCSVNDLCVSPSEPDRMWSPEKLITYGKLPGNKYMINWPIEGNDYYLNIIENTPDERRRLLKKAKDFTLGFVYFIQTELGYNTLGLADDEFPTEDLLPFIPYHRESRRIHGAVRFTLNHITAPYSQESALYRTSIAVGDYPVDHHHARYTGEEELPRLYFHPVPSFGLPLGVMIPGDVDGLIVAEKSISVSNIVNGTTRLQPVVMQIGTAAGALAAIAAREAVSVSAVSVRDVQRAILDAGGYLMPFLDADKNDKRFKAYQRVGVTGILKGEGRNVGWTNQTWLRADSLLLSTELDGLKELYPAMTYRLPREAVALTVKDAVEIIENIASALDAEAGGDRIAEIFKTYDINPDGERKITRGEFAVLVDGVLHPFDHKDVSIDGSFITEKQ